VLVSYFNWSCRKPLNVVITYILISEYKNSCRTNRNRQFCKYKILYIFSRVGVTYETGFGLDNWIYCALYIHAVQDYRQYSAIAILHTLQFTVTHALRFSVFTSRVQATDLKQSHCHFKPHMKTSFPSLISFLPLFSTQFNSSAPQLTSRQACVSKLKSSLLNRLLLLLNITYNHFAPTTQKTASIVERRVYHAVS
jgi:hypothetical protein